MARAKTKTLTIGKNFEYVTVIMKLAPNQLPRITYGDTELDFNNYLNNEAYQLDWEDTELRDCLSPCGRYFIISFSYKNSDLEKVIFFDLMTARFLKGPWGDKLLNGISWQWTSTSELLITYTKPAALFKKEKGMEAWRYDPRSKAAEKIYSSKKCITLDMFYDHGDLHHAVYLVPTDTFSSSVYFKDLDSKKAPVFIKDFNFERAQIIDTCNGNIVYTENNSIKNNGQICVFNWMTKTKTVIVEEYAHLVLDNVKIIYGDLMAVTYVDKQLKNHVKIFSFSGKLIYSESFQPYGEITFEANDEKYRRELKIMLSNFEGIFISEVDLETRSQLSYKVEKFKLYGKINTKFGTYTSFDGVKVPYFYFSHKEKDLDATMLYSYGCYFTNNIPNGQVGIDQLMLSLGAKIMMPCIRGGGERGYNWNRQGAGVNKKNSIRDYLSAAEYLFKKKLATPDTLISHGISGGGLVCAAAMNFAPHYFKVGLPFVGLMDMLNYQAYSSSDNWHKEFGKTTSGKVYKAIASYCPINKVKTQEYPSIYAITGSHDVRAAALHTYKFVDKVQRFNEGNNPVILENVKNHGHFAHLELPAMTKTLSFIFKELNLSLE